MPPRKEAVVEHVVDDIDEANVVGEPEATAPVAEEPAPKRRQKKAEPQDPTADEVKSPMEAKLAELEEKLERVTSKVEDSKDYVPPADPLPYHVRAGVLPIDNKATTELTGKKVAEIMGCEYEDIIGFAVRAPKTVDNDSIETKRVLIVAFADGTKVAKDIGDIPLS